MVHICTPSTQQAEAGGSHNFKTSLAYAASSRTAQTTWRPWLKNRKQTLSLTKPIYFLTRIHPCCWPYKHPQRGTTQGRPQRPHKVMVTTAMNIFPMKIRVGLHPGDCSQGVKHSTRSTAELDAQCTRIDRRSHHGFYDKLNIIHCQ